jgi:hypothetical protein
MRRAAGTLIVFALAACSPMRRGPSPDVLIAQEWAVSLESARSYADSGRHEDADRLLAAFAAQHPGTPHATETLYWRGVYRLDPSNKTYTPADAAQMLDAYLAARPNATNGYQAEASVLRRMAIQVEQLGRAVAAANAAAEAAKQTVAAPPEARPADTGKDQEIARLKSELEKTTDELNRIKRRLSTRP